MTPNPPTPSMIGRYQLVEKIAEGGTGEVFRAFDTKDQRWCAVKRLLPDLAKKTALRTRFEREGNLMARLRHTNIARVHDVGTDSENAFLVMDYAEAGSVADWLERYGQPMPPRMAVALILEVCRGIQYAHEEGVIHRDIKPQNLLLGRDGVCKISDFGIARGLSSHTRMTLTGTVMGTLGYVAPEQYESAKHTDVRADVYSIVATLYTLVHGEAANHLFMADESDYQGIPREIATIIRKGAQYQKDLRHQSVAELMDELEDIFDRLPPDPPGTPPIVPAEFSDLDSAPSLAPVHTPQPAPTNKQRTRRTPPSPLRRNTPREMVPVENRTPSSIIPRNSLTSESTINRLRRPIHQNRDEIERQARFRWIAKLALVMMVVVALLLVAVSFFGAWNIQNASRTENIIGESFRADVRKEAALWEGRSTSPYLTRGKEIRAQFAQLQQETDPNRADGLVTGLSYIFEQELRDLEPRGEEVSSMYKQIESSKKSLKKSLDAYVDAHEERIATESEPFNLLGGWVILFL